MMTDIMRKEHDSRQIFKERICQNLIKRKLCFRSSEMKAERILKLGERRMNRYFDILNIIRSTRTHAI